VHRNDALNKFDWTQRLRNTHVTDVIPYPLHSMST
jgi:hypothetical protein